MVLSYVKRGSINCIHNLLVCVMILRLHVKLIILSPVKIAHAVILSHVIL
jgi:hypothetical protein